MSDGSQGPVLPEEVFGIFAGDINQQAVQRLTNTVTVSANGGVKRLHLAFQSWGGNIADGVALYNIFKACPISVSLYNIGCVQSAAVTAFLGAENRYSSQYATFMIHRASGPSVSVKLETVRSIAHNLALDDDRVEKMFGEHLTLNEDQKATHKLAELFLGAEEAKVAGLISEIREFSPPKGAQIFNASPG